MSVISSTLFYLQVAVHWSSLRTGIIPDSTSPPYCAKHKTRPRTQPRQETMGNTAEQATQGTELNNNPSVYRARLLLLWHPSIDSQCD